MEKMIRNPDKDERVLVCDVDDTLVMWGENAYQPTDGTIEFKDPYNGDSLFLKPHKRHIKLLEHFHSRGYYVIVWSAGGGKWAKSVVNTLEINHIVDDIMGKPLKYIDDLPAQEWMGNRIYVEDKND